MSSQERLSPKQELIANFEQRSRDNFIFRLFWMYSQLYGSKRALESLPETGSLSEYCQAILNGFNLEISSELPEWLQSENGQGVLIYGPHTYHLEPFILANLLSHREIYFVALSHSLFMLPDEFQAMSLPVTPSHLAKDARKMPGLAGIRQRISRSMFAKDDMRSVAEMKRANLDVLQKAAELLKAGKVVIIFPAASDDIYNSGWNNGLGNIIHYLDPEIDNVLLQPFDITQITFGKAIRNMRSTYVLHRPGEPTKIDVTWKPPMTLAELFATTSQIAKPEPNEVVQLLAKHYRAQSR